MGVIIIFIIITSKEDRGDHPSSKNRNHVKRGDGSTAVFLHFQCMEINARGGGGDVDDGDGRRSPQLPQSAHIIIVNRNHHYVAAGFVSGRYATTLACVCTVHTPQARPVRRQSARFSIAVLAHDLNNFPKNFLYT